MISGDERLVVFCDCIRVAIVFHLYQLDGMAEDAATAVDHVGPELVALILRFAILGEVAGDRIGVANSNRCSCRDIGRVAGTLAASGGSCQQDNGGRGKIEKSFDPSGMLN